MPKPPKTEVTEAQVAATLAQCGNKNNLPSADRVDSGARLAAVTYGVNNNYTPADYARAGRMSTNMGQCVADAYSDKEPTAGDKLSAWASGLMNTFSNAASNAANAVKEELKVGGTGLVRDATNGITQGGLDTVRDTRIGPSGVPNTLAAKL